MSRHPIHRLLIVIVIVVSLYAYVTYYYYYTNGITAKTLKPEMVEVQRANYSMYCDWKSADLNHQPCLCYADFYPRPGAIRNSTSAALFDPDSVKCAMTFGTAGRLGNQMSMYATLLVLARLNHRPAFIKPRMSRLLSPYFRISLPVLTQERYEEIAWKKTRIERRMQPSYLNFSGEFIKLHGFPHSNHYTMGFEEEIRREFRFKDEIQDGAAKVLKDIASSRTTSSVTFVGVHVRRGDYIRLMNANNAVVADRAYFSRATAYFRSKYADAVFVVVSDDMEWCVENIDNDRKDVVYAGNNNESDPYSDLALLVNCNHSIITIGSFGFFAGFLAGGHVVYFTNFTKPNSADYPIDYGYPKHWHSIAATDFSSLDKYTRN